MSLYKNIHGFNAGAFFQCHQTIMYIYLYEIEFKALQFPLSIRIDGCEVPLGGGMGWKAVGQVGSSDSLVLVITKLF